MLSISTSQRPLKLELPMMARPRLRTIHIAAACIAMAMILLFQTSTITSEIFGNSALVAQVKRAIVIALPLLVLALATVGATGMGLAGRKPKGLAARKLGRMRVVAAIGLFILVPAALFLNWKAGHGELDAAFYLVQGIEIVAGLANLLLLGLNMRDGIRMGGGRRSSPPPLSAHGSAS